MKGYKIFAVCAAALLFLAPATAMAKGPHFSFSFGFFQRIPEFFCPPPPPVVVPVVRERVYVPCPPPPVVEERTIVKEYHYYFDPYGKKMCREEIKEYPRYTFHPVTN